ncbi:hypothetical protein WA026_016854 [Henosepilachna vigintioctopunctata]|uniref:Uncharacterized protein n=1 Tax=Henosepilachna vigintioctopunctata TaxID=420089 RepID=A0AAW1UCX5_9CUCU
MFQRRKKKYRQSRFHNVEELTSLLESSDHDEVIENEDTLEMVYLPFEDYMDDNSNDNDITRNINEVPKLKDPDLTKNIENICAIKNGDQKLLLSMDSGIEETADPVVSGVKDFNKMTLTVKTAQAV